MNEDFQWTSFARGFVFWEKPDPEYEPPGANAIEDLSEWLTGFCQAYADYPHVFPQPPYYEDAGESVDEALERLLPDHPSLPVLKMMLKPM